MFNMPAIAVQNQKPRIITPGRGMLCDQFQWQYEFEIGGSHPGEFQVSRFKLQVVRQRDLKSGLLAWIQGCE